MEREKENEKEKLTVILFTFNLDAEILPSKYIPKVCRKINDKSMIYLAVELANKLSPHTIFIHCNKYNISSINKELKSFKNQKNISFVFDIFFLKDNFSFSSVLAFPAYSPLISLKTLKYMCSFKNVVSGEQQNIKDYCKCKNNLFYISSSFIPSPISSKDSLLSSVKKLKDNVFLLEDEMLEVNSQEEYDKAKELYNKRINAFS